GDGLLAVHSAIRMSEDDAAAVDDLGRVSLILAPNRFHAAEAPWYAERYPDARVLVPGGGRAKLEPAYPRIDGTLEADWPLEIDSEIRRVCLAGMRMGGETVFLHVKSRTLVTTDMVFNLGDRPRGLFRILMKLNRAYDRFGPTRLFLSAFVRDKVAFDASVREVLEWDFDRVIMSHGEVVETGGKAMMREAFRA
ncbi:MAG: hypothetical protein R3344_02420, partial [Acidobacteriota bacterium]|nr:hypothetical protein [Acidobacteriota bacterium]